MQQQQQPNFFGMVVWIIACWWISGWAEANHFRPNGYPIAFIFHWAAIIIFVILVIHIIRLIPGLIWRMVIKRPRGEKGTAEWGTLKDARKAGLLKRGGRK